MRCKLSDGWFHNRSPVRVTFGFHNANPHRLDADADADVDVDVAAV